jgi:DDE superfamily endonuclease
VGLEDERRFCRYHRVLSRAVWPSKEASRLLLGLLIKAFVAEGAPLVVGVDETLERRRGKKIAPKGIYWTYPHVADKFRLRHRNLLHCSLLILSRAQVS